MPSAALIAVAAALVATTLLAGSVLRDRSGGQPAFLANALGSSLAAAPDRRTANGDHVRLPRSGYALETPTHRVVLSSADPAGTSWSQHQRGATRTTPFGAETVVVDGDGVEQFLTVTERTGPKTWRWRLDTGTLKPHLRPDGSILISAGNLVAGFRVSPAAVLDRRGHDVTPAGTGWGLDRSKGSWWLTLALDDTSLPLPYVIDPATIALRQFASANTGGAATGLTITKPVGLALDDQMIAQVTVKGGTGTVICPPSGWTSVDRRDSTTLAQEIFRKAAVAADVAAANLNFVFTFGTASGCATTSSLKASGGIIAYYGVDNSTPVSAVNGQANASSVNIAAPTITPGANDVILGVFGTSIGTTVTEPTGTPTFTEQWDTAASTGGLATTRTTSEIATALSGGTATGIKTAVAVVAAANIGQLVSLKLDTTAPTAPALTVTESDIDTFNSGTTLYYRPGGNGGTFTVDATTTETGSGVKQMAFPGLTGNFTPITTTNDTVSPYSQVYTWTTGATDTGAKTVMAEDNATNTNSSTFTLTSDSTGPPTTVTTTEGANAGLQHFVNTGPNAYTLYYRPTATGDYTFSAAAVDASSGTAQVVFPTLATTGFTGTTLTDTLTPYASNTYTFTAANVAAPGNVTIVSTDNVGNSTTDTITFDRDTTLPVSGALTVNSVAATGGGSQSYDGDGGFTIGTRTDYTDAGAGIATSVLTREDGTLSGDICSSYGAPATITGSTAQSGLATGCYRYVLTGTDNVGNTSTLTTVVKVDTSAPAAPSLTLSDSSADVHTTGTTAFYRPAGSGAFDVTAAATDAQSGILDYSFPALAGFTASGSGATKTYTLATPTEADGAKPVTARNSALLSSTATNFTLTADSTAPTSAYTFPAAAGNYNTAGWGGSITGTASDGGAGLSTVQVAIQQGAGNYYDGASFANPGITWLTPTGTSIWSYAIAAAKLASGSTYTISVRSTDNVANIETAVTRTFTYDTAAPTFGTLALGGATNSSVSGTTVYYRGAVAGSFTLSQPLTDPVSGPASVQFPAIATAGWTHGNETVTGSSPYVSATFSWTSSPSTPASYTLTGADVAGNTATRGLTFTNDSSVPTTGGSLDVNGTSASAGGTTSTSNGSFGITRVDYGDSGSGLASSTLTWDVAPYTNDSCGTYGGSPTTIDGTPAQNLTVGCYLYVLTGTDQVGNTTSISTVVQVHGAAATQIVLTESGSNVAGGSHTLTATIEDANGNTVTSDSTTQIAFSQVSGAGTVSGLGSAPAAAGVATKTLTNLLAGAINLDAQAGSLTAGTTSYTIVAGTASTSTSTITAAPNTLTADGSSASTITVQLKDTVGNNLTGSGGTVALSRTGTGTLSAVTDNTDGSYTATLTAPTTVGSATISATLNASPLASTDSVSYTHGPATQIVLTESGSTVSGGSHTLTATIQDAAGNTVTSDSSTSVTFAQTGGAGSVSGLGSAPVTAGVATTTLTNLGAGAINLDAQAGSLTAGTTSYTIVAGTASTSTSTIAAAPATLVNNGTDTATITVTLRDAGGNPISGHDVSLAQGGGSSSISAPSGSSSAAGVVTFTVTNTKIEVVTYTATDTTASVTITDTANVNFINPDGTPPTNTLSIVGVSGDTPYLTGTTVFFRGSGGGTFRLRSAVADGASGPASAEYPTLTQTGWTSRSSETISTPSGGPYDSTNFGWAGSTATFTQSVTARDQADNTQVTTLTFKDDSTIPTGGALTVNGGATYSTSGSFSISRTDYGETASGTESGLAASTLTREVGALSSDSCSAYGAPASFGGASESGLASGCYRYVLTGTDRVGNAASITRVVKVDTTAPSTPTLTFGSATNASLTGSTVYFRSGVAGGFTLTPSSTDADTGVTGYAFPSLGSGWSAGGAYTFGTSADDPTEPLAVTATNGAGTPSAGASFTVTPDALAPVTTAQCDGAACVGAWHTSSPVSVTLSAADGGSGVDMIKYTTDGTEPSILSGSLYVGAISIAAEGTTDVKFRAYDEVGNEEAVATIQVRIDTVPPGTTIDSGPPSLSNSASASFTYSSDDGAATFECSLDGGSFGACSNPSGLAEGAHTYQVRAVDQAGNVDATPASRAWTVDTVDPVTAIDSGPSGSTNSTSASIAFSSNESGSTFECSLDGGAFAACTSPHALAGLAEGSHTFQVRATDQAGNVDPTPASYTWTVDTTAPQTTITVQPANPSASTAPSFSFTSTEAGTFACRLDLGAWASCTSPHALAALTDGSHTLAVEATDAAGNADATPVSYTWVVDATNPTGSLTAPGPGAAVSGTTTVSSSSADGGSGVFEAEFQYLDPVNGWTSIGTDSSAAGGYGVSWATTGVADGDYDLRAITRDIAGNSFTSPVRTVTVDNTAPALTLDAPAVVNTSSADPETIAATATDAGTGVASVLFEQCLAAGSTCAAGWVSLGVDTTSPYSIAWPVPTDGSRVVKATATDAAGRSTSDTFVVLVDRTRPVGTVTAPAAAADLRRTIGLTASASDTAPGTVNTVTFQSSPAGANTWSAISTDSSAPYAASLDTVAAGLADGLYDLRVFTTDAAGNAEASPATIQVRIDNTDPTGSVTAPADGANVRGSITLTSDSADAGSGVDTVVFETRPSGGGTWTMRAPAFATSGVADGLYDLRVTTTDRAGNSRVSPVIGIRVDNTLPTGTVTAPAAAADLAGTIALTSDSADAGSGVDTVVFEQKPSSGGTWTAVTASWNTKTGADSVADGLYDLRVTTTDLAGNAFTSGTVQVRVDNTAPTGALTQPVAGPAGGTIALASDSADAGSGVTSALFRYRPAGGPTWTEIATDTAAPYGASLATLGSVADGAYELQVSTTDRAGNTTDSALVAVTVDNTAPTTSASASPGTLSNAPVTVSLSAADGSGSGVSFSQFSLDDGATWTTGTSTIVAAPGDHSNDGSHAIKYRSLDVVGNVEATKTITVVIDTTAPSGTPGNPGDYLRGIASLTYSTAAPDVASVQFEFSPAAAGAWAAIGGADIAAPYAVDWNTGGGLVTDGAYDLRVVVVDSAGNTSTQLLPGVPKYVDNTAPTGAVTGPAAAAYVFGAVDLTATAGDGALPPASGVSAVRFEVKPAGAGSFSPVGTQTTPIVGSTYRQSWDSSTVADGPVELQVVVTDVAGNSVTSAQRTINVDNDAPTIALDVPPADASNAFTLTATAAADTQQVEFQRRAAGTLTWTSLGTDATAPFQSTFDMNVGEGTWEIRAIATDAGANTGTSGIVTVRVDKTLPTGTLTAPSAGQTIGGASVSLAASAADTLSGVASVQFQVQANGAPGFTTVAAVTSSPYAATWDARSTADGAAQVRLVITDAAGNVRTTAGVAVTIDSTAPTVTLANPGALLGGTVTLTATTTGVGATSVVFAITPAGQSSWTTIATDTTSPYSTSFDTRTVGDGVYELRAIVSDALGNTSSHVRSNVTIDNTAPSLVGASPADGSTVASANQLVLTASEPVSVASVKLDGSAAPAPSVSGTQVTFATGALAEGLHVLQGDLVDVRGTHTMFRVAVAVMVPGSGTLIPTEISVAATGTTTLASSDGDAIVSVPSGAFPAGDAGDIPVLRIKPSPGLPGTPNFTFAGRVYSIQARWAQSGASIHEFNAPLEIVMPDNATHSLVAATSNDGITWRSLPLLATPGVLPATQADGFSRAADGVHIYTRHLSYFALMLDTEAPSPPAFGAVVAADGLTLRWDPGTDNSGQLGHFVLFVNGEPFQNFDLTQFETKMGAFDASDTRTFSMAETDAAGNGSQRTAALRALPQLSGLTLDDARAALTARGFSVGSVVETAAPGVVAGTVVAPADVRLAATGSTVNLSIARAEPAPAQTPLVFTAVATKRLPLEQRDYIGTRIKTSRPATVSATLRTTTTSRPLQTWRLQVKAGAHIVKLHLPLKLRRAGSYRLTLVAHAGRATSRRVLNVALVGPRLMPLYPAKPGTTRRVEVLLVGKQASAKQIGPTLDRVNARALESSDDMTFTLAGAQTRNVSVIVVNVDEVGLTFIRDLRIMFPMVHVLALSNNASTLGRSVLAGATLALARTTSTATIARAIATLATAPRF